MIKVRWEPATAGGVVPGVSDREHHDANHVFFVVLNVQQELGDEFIM